MVTKTLDDVIGSNPNMGRSVFDELQCARQHSDDTGMLVLIAVSAKLPIELPVQLVGAVNQVNDHNSKLGGE